MAIGSKNKDRIIDAIRNRKDFTVASMSGTRIGASYPVQVGQLKDRSPVDVKRLTQGIAAGIVSYVVYSFGTPIAWVENGVGYAPDVRYSVTTSQHQTIARVALDV